MNKRKTRNTEKISDDDSVMNENWMRNVVFQRKTLEEPDSPRSFLMKRQIKEWLRKDKERRKE